MTARKMSHRQWQREQENDRRNKEIEHLIETDKTFSSNYGALTRNSSAHTAFVRTNRGYQSRFEVCKSWLVRSALARKRREEAEAQRENSRLNRVEQTLSWE